MKVRRNILLVVNNSEFEEYVKETLGAQLKDTNVSPIVISAHSGPEAAFKSEKQKFDLIIIDTESPRLKDGGFILGLDSYKNTQDAKLVVVVQAAGEELPAQLKRGKVFSKPISYGELMAFLTQDLLANVKAEQQESKVESAGGSSAANSGGASASQNGNGKFIVDVRVVNAAVKGTTSVLNKYGLHSINMDKPGPRSPHDPLSGEISSVVEIKSNSFVGYLAVSFDKGSYLEVLSKMMGNEQIEINESNRHAVGEINNVIFSVAKSEIENFGVRMALPKIIIGTNKTIPSAEGAGGIVIPFTTEKGKFHIIVVAYPSVAQAA